MIGYSGMLLFWLVTLIGLSLRITLIGPMTHEIYSCYFGHSFNHWDYFDFSFSGSHKFLADALGTCIQFHKLLF